MIQGLQKLSANIKEKGYPPTYKRLLQRATENQSQWTASIVKYLLDHGADVHFKHKYGHTALHDAARNPSNYTVDVMKILVKHGSNVNKKKITVEHNRFIMLTDVKPNGLHQS